MYLDCYRSRKTIIKSTKFLSTGSMMLQVATFDVISVAAAVVIETTRTMIQGCKFLKDSN